MSAQAPSAVILIRATSFVPNPATAADNAFQADVPGRPVRPGHVGACARRRWTPSPRPCARSAYGSTCSTTTTTPGPTASSPTTGSRPTPAAPSRSTRCMPPTAATSGAPTCWRCSSRTTACRSIVDYSGLEPDGVFLEGTGAMVLDNVSRVAYIARSHRADSSGAGALLHRLHLRADGLRRGRLRRRAGLPHQRHRLHRHATSRMIALDLIPDEAAPRAGARAARRHRPHHRRADRGADPRVRRQRRGAVPVLPHDGRHRYVMAMSARARARCLTETRSPRSRSSCEIVAVDIPTIELAGGSVRCMIAGVHLDHRPERLPEHQRGRRRDQRGQPDHPRRPLRRPGLRLTR